MYKFPGADLKHLLVCTCASSRAQPKGILWYLASSFELSLIHHLAMAAEVEISSVRDADHRDVV